jgi:putative glutamine amidotransferase
MTKPLIGLNVDVDVTKPEQVRLARAYYEAVEKAGGIPVLIPPCKHATMCALLDRLDGVLLIGGRDYDPAYFGEASHESVALLHPDRIKFDLALAKEAIKRNLPVLGICGGLQLINIALGGSLIIDIPTYLATGAIKHRATEGERRAEHPASVIRDSLLFSIYGSVIAVTVSSHHQAANRLGRRLKAVAFAPDGIIEAIEHRFKRFVVGVQWHPERDFAGNRRLFRAFIEACKRTKRRG